MASTKSRKSIPVSLLTPFECVGLLAIQVVNSLLVREQLPPPPPPEPPGKLIIALPPAPGFLLGTAATTGAPIYATDEDLKRHMYLLGATGSGKTTMIIRLFDREVSRWP